MPAYPPGMAPPPGMPAPAKPSGSMPPEVLLQKSQKWIQMQKKRYGEKRKGGYVDMGKQVSNHNHFYVRRRSDRFPGPTA